MRIVCQIRDQLTHLPAVLRHEIPAISVSRLAVVSRQQYASDSISDSKRSDSTVAEKFSVRIDAEDPHGYKSPNAATTHRVSGLWRRVADLANNDRANNQHSARGRF